MEHKEALFKLLRECAENPQEKFAVEEMISKIEGIMPKIEVIDENHQKWNGFKFSRNKSGRFSGTFSIYRLIWTYFNGEIPEGYDIHHRDLNHENNDISNLQLLTKDEHKKVHGRKAKRMQNESKSTCGCCGKEFEPSHGNNLYCSDECRRKVRRDKRMVEHPCSYCGKIFLTQRDRKAKFCSKECLRKSKSETKICPFCGKEFSVLKSRGKKVFCSKECSYRARRKNPEPSIQPAASSSVFMSL